MLQYQSSTISATRQAFHYYYFISEILDSLNSSGLSDGFKPTRP